MKKILIFSAIAAAALTVLSCERETVLTPGEEGTPVSLSLDLNLSGIATKAFADGSLVDELHVGVYDASGNFLEDLTPAEAIAFTPNGARFNATVTVGQSYKIAFWAQKAGTGNYTVDFAAKTITANYTANTTASDETFDAFYALYETGVVNEAINANVTLKRPLAQLNVFTPTENVTEAAQRETPVTITSAGMTVSAVKNVLNPLDGTLSGSVDVTFNATECTETSILDGYTYVEMNYIFAGANEANKTVSVVVNFDGADPQTFDLTNVPVKRNRRTNIRGNVFPTAETPQPTTVDLTLTATLGTAFDEDAATADLTGNQGGNGTNVYTSTFTSKDWESTGDFAWTAGASGAGFLNNGIQVTTSSTGANGTTNKTFTNISKVVVTYNTNKSKGNGTLEMTIGSNEAQTSDWAFSGSEDGTSAYFTCTFDVENHSGSINVKANTTTNSIYIVSVAVTAESISE